MVPAPYLSRGLEAYKDLLAEEAILAIRKAAAVFHGLRIVHINATPTGGGVAEVLASLVPLMQDVGLVASWLTVEAPPEFFAVTKKVHNSLQGKPISLDPREIDLYMAYNQRFAQELENQVGSADVLVLHDPQVLPSVSSLDHRCQVIWHCHLDTSTPNPEAQALIVPLTQIPTRCIVSMPHYVMQGMSRERVAVFPPAIDPFTDKNSPLPRSSAMEILSRMGLDLARPLVTQVSRFDPWKDPWGVIDAYRLAKREIPALQLAIVGAMTAQDDPESAGVLESVRAYAADDPDIHLFSEPAAGQPVPVNAFQTLSTVIVQKSVREGFGLTVTEAMWKGTAVVGGRCGGIVWQIQEGVTGYLAGSPEECADRIVHLIKRPDERARIGASARERVLSSFLMPRLLLDYLQLLDGVHRTRQDRSPSLTH
ncbi:MAG: glycosyltransferase [Dehalococcoidia bacterium]